MPPREEAERASGAGAAAEERAEGRVEAEQVAWEARVAVEGAGAVEVARAAMAGVPVAGEVI